MKNKNIKNNIDNLDNNNYNYKGREEAQKLPKLFPQEDEIDMRIFGIKQNRKRYQEFPDRLPTNNNEMPYPPDDHVMIGEYEHKHNLYLIFAHAYNKVMKRLDKLEKQINK